MNYTLDWKEYAAVARQAVAESCVLVRNENQVLPLEKGSKVALFGRMQFHYIKSGTGSGGLVNAPYVTGLLETIEGSNHIQLNQELLNTYKNWLEDHPFDRGQGWAQEPWAQEEMELTKEIVQKARETSDIGVIVIGRQAGEDRDNDNKEGSYLLTKQEESMLKLVTQYFDKTVVLLNVGNIMDMNWVETYKPQSVLYIWQGGCEGATGAMDIITGAKAPSGKLTDTIAFNIEDYPSTQNFGDKDENIYTEDIYVGYRYFETFAKEKVMYPFGYGLSYTTFDIQELTCTFDDLHCKVNVIVENTGQVSGKEVIQIYINPPQGKLGKPLRNLVAFGKTKELESKTSEELVLEFNLKDFASFDDSGVTGHKNTFVLEEGVYEIYVGTNVANAQLASVMMVDKLQVVEQLSGACAPVKAFERMKPEIKDGAKVSYETAPQREENFVPFASNHELKEVPYTGNKGYTLTQVKEEKVSLEDFLAQLSNGELTYMTRGEGMCSPKVTPGTAGAIGGVTKELQDTYKIPLACCADGPSGIRMDSGAMAYSLPNGTALASTFNTQINFELFTFLGKEMSLNCVDTLLGPGINIHRNPLNGRNFEYFSEDPYVTGAMTVAQLKALHAFDVTGTIKHFACNNQEIGRSTSSSVLSTRAMREIYLKAYEMAVKEAGAYSIMSTYGAVNGIWTASYYELLTTILREEWGFEGIVMTDWWAKMNDEGKEPTMTNTPAMIRAQNDVYMVVDNAKENTMKDTTSEGLESGSINRAMLIRVAGNICKFIMKSAVQKRFMDGNSYGNFKIEEINRPVMEEVRCVQLPTIESIENSITVDCKGIDTSKGASVKFFVEQAGVYHIKLTVSADVKGIAQVPVTVYNGIKAIRMLTLNKENCKDITIEIPNVEIVKDEKEYHFIKLFFAEGGMEIKELKIIK